MDILAQVFGIIGLIIIVSSFQFKKNSTFFFLQGTGSLMFFLNFILIGAYGGAFFNMCNLLRGLLFMKNQKKNWKLAVLFVAYVGCFVFSCILDHSARSIALVALPCIALLIMSVCMWYGNPMKIRIAQIALSSPAWIVHNIFNLSVGGLICECFNIVSSVVYVIRQKKAEKKQ